MNGEKPKIKFRDLSLFLISMTLGLFSSATGLRLASIGYVSESIGKYSFPLGDFVIANGDSGIAIGKNSLLYENSEYSIVLGSAAYIGKRKEVSSSAIIDSGNGSVVDGNNTASTGTPGSVRTKATEYTQMNPAPERWHNNSIAIGLSAKVYGYQSIAIGGTAEASKSDSIAIGTGAESRGHFSSALGSQAIANSDYSLALGRFTYAKNKKSITIGDNSSVQVDGGISLGSTSFNNRSTEILGYDFSEKHTKLTVDATDATKFKMELQGEMKTKYEALDAEVKPLQQLFDQEEEKYNKLVKQRDTIYTVKVKENELESLKNNIASESNEAKKQKLEEAKTKLEAELNKDKETLKELETSSGLTNEEEVKKEVLKQSQIYELSPKFFLGCELRCIELKNTFIKFKDSLQIPDKTLVSICGQSGVGKSILLKELIQFSLDDYIYVSQKPIKGNITSSVGTYLGLISEIKKMFIKNTEIKQEDFQKNKCNKCKGLGIVSINTYYDAPYYTVCDSCKGSGCNNLFSKCEIGGFSYDDMLLKPIDEILRLEEEYLSGKLKDKLQDLSDIGLGYLNLNRRISTLSGGENQRIKLMKALWKKINFIGLDEPCQGLDEKSIKKFLEFIYNDISINGRTYIVAEHNITFLKYSSYLIELVRNCGYTTIIYNGRTDKINECKDSAIAKWL